MALSDCSVLEMRACVTVNNQQSTLVFHFLLQTPDFAFSEEPSPLIDSGFHPSGSDQLTPGETV